MADVFDQVHQQAQGDVFDQLHQTPAQPRGFWGNAWDATIGNLINGVKEYANRPEETRKMFDALHTLKQAEEQGRDLTPDEQSTVQRGMSANVSNPMGATLPLGSEPLGKAGYQATHGDVMGGLGTLAGSAAMVAVPAVAGALLRKTVGGATPRAVAETMYKGALRPPVNTPLDQVSGAVQAGLDNFIPITPEGAAKLSGLIQDLDRQIFSKTEQAAQTGVKISPKRVVSRLDDLATDYESQSLPEKDLKAVQDARAEFMRQHSVSTKGKPIMETVPSPILDQYGNPLTKQVGVPQPGPDKIVPIPADQAQAMKQGTYAAAQRIKATPYGQEGSAPLEIQKALGRGLKEELENAIPELKDLNATQQRQLNLEGLLTNRVTKAANSSGSGLTGLATAEVANSLLKNPSLAMAAGVMRVVMRDPAVRSRLAIAINQAQQTNPAKWGAPSMAKALAKIDIYSSALNPTPSQGGDGQ